jgi:hypothetical protein
MALSLVTILVALRLTLPKGEVTVRVGPVA